MGRPKGSKNKKRGPGRPKGSKNGVIKLKKVLGRRGKPPGSKNKTSKVKKGQRGRPKGSKNRKSYTEYPTHNSHDKMFAVPPDYKEPPVKKFLGFCKCGFMINSSDKVSALMYICPGCSKKNRISKLKKEVKRGDKPKTKKEYLEDTVFNTRLVEDVAAPVVEAEEEIPEVEEVLEEDKKEKDDEIK